MSSLYVHIPFCSRKCPYCDFFSQVGSQQNIEEYVDLLCLNINLLRQEIPLSPPFQTIFFGGGTPSLLSVKQIDKILNSLQQNLGIVAGAEITLEANPGTLNQEKLRGYRGAGVNRLSLGIQSFNDQNLQRLGRIHTVAQAENSILAARAAGFDNLNLDLMFALPGQSLMSLKGEITSMLNFEPEHISLYGLSFEEGTEFFLRRQAGEIIPCKEGLYADQYQLLHNKLTMTGYEHYEISNFARSGRRCRHNQRYWQRKKCHAIGVGAHGFEEKGWGMRWYVPADLKRYGRLLLERRNPAVLLEASDHYQAMREYVYLALRTSDGIHQKKFQQQFGLQFEDVFNSAIKKTGQYFQSNNDSCCFGVDGWLIYDHLISDYL